MENIEEFYLSLKDQFAKMMPMAKIGYITYDTGGYHLGKDVCISFREADTNNTIEALKRVAITPDFYAFNHSEKGIQFFTENKKVVSDLVKNFFLGNAGYLNNTLQVNDESERMQLIRSLAKRQESLNDVYSEMWDSILDSQGSLEDCKAAVSRLLAASKKIKLNQ